ncbi:prepilin-type N-terminal cleavage/methylation domain-containing protein [Saccharospirillum impatiens]|uniref:prepilin-type N-terminal cleavage/methylation domain-containing protein n=1 Tax=Saccharospirillum impatiens TaxID=169438 RepID=UPI0004009725|nr:prepilin-type N-terminal cleavage/methylation domain-containing protein [Saccharospirillum impatiens]
MKPTRRSHSCLSHQGFSLLELMVVIVIIGIAAGAVRLAVTGNDPVQELEEAAGQYAYRMERIQDQVLLSNRERGLMFVGDGVYQLEWREGDEMLSEPDIVWSLFDEQKAWGVSEAIQLGLTLDNQWVELNQSLPTEPFALEPHVILLPSEDYTPAYNLVLSLTDSINDEVRVEADGFNSPKVLRDER